MSDTSHYERISVEAGGVRIPACPRCGSPLVIDRSIERATFGQCPNGGCGAWIAYDVSVTAVALNDRESAKYHFETYIHDDE